MRLLSSFVYLAQMVNVTGLLLLDHPPPKLEYDTAPLCRITGILPKITHDVWNGTRPGGGGVEV